MERLVQKLSNVKVLVIGDGCLDSTLKVSLSSKENPEDSNAKILLVEEYSEAPGMAANVALGLGKLGLKVDTLIKGDTVKTRVVDIITNKQIVRYDDDNSTNYSEYTLETLKKLNLRYYTTIVISDYCKGAVDYKVLDYIKKVTVNSPTVVFLDTKKRDLQEYSTFYIKINRKEANALVRKPSALDTFDYTEGNRLIVTEGANGARYDNTIIQPPKVQVVDVCGAGDAFLCGLVAGYYLEDGVLWKAIMDYANIAGSICVTKRGCYVPSLEELINVRNSYYSRR